MNVYLVCPRNMDYYNLGVLSMDTLAFIARLQSDVLFCHQQTCDSTDISSKFSDVCM